MPTLPPPPLARPMSAADAAWIREHAWTRAMRASYRQLPGYWTTCPCQWECPQCDRGQHHRCGRAEPLVRPMGGVLARGGTHAARHPEPYQHPTPTATVPTHTSQAQVWLADHACAWRCRCGCRSETTAAPVEQAAPVTAAAPVEVPEGQLTFGDVADEEDQEPGVPQDAAPQDAAPQDAAPRAVDDPGRRRPAPDRDARPADQDQVVTLPDTGPDPSDPRQVLAYLRTCGLADADTRPEDLPRAAYTLAAEAQRLATRAAERRDREAAELAAYFAEGEANRRAHQAKADRKEAIRAWAKLRGYQLGSRLPARVIRAYEVEVEGDDGQPTLY